MPPATPSSSSILSPSFSLCFSSSTDKVEVGVNRLVAPIICEEDEEEEMTSNLRVRFYKRQCKGLFEYIFINLSPSKKTCSTPGPNSPSKPTSPTFVAVIASSLDEKPSSIDDISYHEMRKPFVVTGRGFIRVFELFSFLPEASLCLQSGGSV